MSSILPAVISGGASLIGTAVNAASTARQNRLSREFTVDMWEKQNNVNDANWQRDAAYNSPTSQMQRFSAAGLNPYLIYGESGGGNVSANSVAAPSASPYRPEVPKVDLGGAAQAGLSAYYNASMNKAQVDNLAASTMASQASAVKSLSDASATNFDVSQRQRLADVSADMAHSLLLKSGAETETIKAAGHLSADQRVKIQAEIKQIGQNMSHEQDKHPVNMQILNSNADFQSFKAKLAQDGFTEHDSVLWRLFSKFGSSFGKALNYVPKSVPPITKP